MSHSRKSHSRLSHTPSDALSDYSPSADSLQHSRSNSGNSNWSNHCTRFTETSNPEFRYLDVDPHISNFSDLLPQSNHHPQASNTVHHASSHHEPSSSHRTAHRLYHHSSNSSTIRQSTNTVEQTDASSRSKKDHCTSNRIHQHCNHRSQTPLQTEEESRSRRSQSDSCSPNAQQVRTGSQSGSSSQHVRQTWKPKWFPDFIVDSTCTKCAIPVQLRTREEAYKHLRYVHKMELYRCYFANCMHVSRITGGISQHVVVHGRNLTHKCEKCSASFHYRSNLVAHMKESHD